MWEISEGENKFLYAIKLVPSQDLGFGDSKAFYCKVLEALNASSLSSSISYCVEMSSRVNGADQEKEEDDDEEEEISSSSPKKIMHPTYTLA